MIKLSTVQFVPDSNKTKEMCDKAANRCFLLFIHILDWYKAQEMRDRVIFEDPFMLVYCPDRYKTQIMCDEAADDCLAALELLPDLFVTSKMLEKLDNTLQTNDDILFYNEDFEKVRFIANQILNKWFWWRWYWYYYSFVLDILLGVVNLKKAKHLKKVQWRMSMAFILKDGGILHVIRWEQRNRTNPYWVMFLVHISTYTIWEYWNIFPQLYRKNRNNSKSLWVLSAFVG